RRRRGGAAPDQPAPPCARDGHRRRLLVPDHADPALVASRVRVERIDLAGFRCYETAAASFAAGVTAVVGPNGAGKTSLLEAVHLALCGYSPRTTVEARCVREGSPFLRLEAVVADGGRRHDVSLALA